MKDTAKRKHCFFLPSGYSSPLFISSLPFCSVLSSPFLSFPLLFSPVLLPFLPYFPPAVENMDEKIFVPRHARKRSRVTGTNPAAYSISASTTPLTFRFKMASNTAD